MSQWEDFLNWTRKAFRASFPELVSFLLFCTASPVYCLEKIGVKKGSGRSPQEKVPPLDGWRCLVPNVFVSEIYDPLLNKNQLQFIGQMAKTCKNVLHWVALGSSWLDFPERRVLGRPGTPWEYQGVGLPGRARRTPIPEHRDMVRSFLKQML